MNPLIEPVEYWNEFIRLQLPTRKSEHWKYADISFLKQNNFVSALPHNAVDCREKVGSHRLKQSDSILLVFINGYFQPMLSDLHKLPNEITITDSASVLNCDIDQARYPFAAINAAITKGSFCIAIAEGYQLKESVHCLFLAVGEEAFITHPRHHLVLGNQSKATILEEYVNVTTSQIYLMNRLMTIHAGKEAALHHYKIQAEGAGATHIAHVFLNQKQNSRVEMINLSLGGKFSRDELVVGLKESGASCSAAGYYRLNHDNQYIDHHVTIDHQAAYTESEMLYKGTIDKNARAVFNGRLHVDHGAKKIVAYQANHHLLLSNKAEAYSKPELEIYADDVKCKHGATTGQLDQDALFYLRSRGMPEQEATRLLLEGFAATIFERMIHPAIRERAEERFAC